ncbi:unnamed protein product [Adineta ricciae]|uniref:Uncharacterized protein n=1 Tax=Adineta ricciae TaxID=249248 RepID=A0A815FT25_ADIRI|nr:unnamed protein product [Adineta ricciae]CAF1485509.1 unnamed protein product [Adineta ricciae]
MTDAQSTSNVGVGREGVCVDFRALVSFSGGYSPEQVRGGLSGPHLGGHPSIIWRKTTIYHSNQDGSYCLYACERSGAAMWVPVGDLFVANRPLGSQASGSLMDYILSDRRRQTVGPTGYGFHSTGRTTSGENGNIRRPLGTHASVMRREPATRLHRHNPLVRPEPVAAGAGSRRTVARRERRERLRAHHPEAPPPPPTTTTTTTTSAVVEANGNEQVQEDDTEREDDGPRNTPQRTIFIYNSNMGANIGGQATSQMAILNLSDEES